MITTLLANKWFCSAECLHSGYKLYKLTPGSEELPRTRIGVDGVLVWWECRKWGLSSVMVWSHYCCCRQLVAGRGWTSPAPWPRLALVWCGLACWSSVTIKTCHWFECGGGGRGLSWLWRVSTGPSLCWAASSWPPQRASWTISEIEKISVRWEHNKQLVISSHLISHFSFLISFQKYFLNTSPFSQNWL